MAQLRVWDWSCVWPFAPPNKAGAALSTKPCSGLTSREMEGDQILTAIQVLDPARRS